MKMLLCQLFYATNYLLKQYDIVQRNRSKQLEYLKIISIQKTVNTFSYKSNLQILLKSPRKVYRDKLSHESYK